MKFTAVLATSFLAFQAQAGSTQPDPSKKAWVSILTNDSFNHTEMLSAQIRSIKKYSNYKEHVTLILPTVSDELVANLESLGTKITRVDRIESPFYIERSWWQDVFAKLHIFNLTDYSQVTYVDSDAFIGGAEADLIFDECQADICGVQDAIDVEFLGERAGYTMMNAGVMCVRPSKARFDFITQEALPQAREHFLPEQGFFADAFVIKKFGREVGTVQWLNWRYNTCSMGYYGLVNTCENSHNKEGEDLDLSFCSTQFKEQVSIFHSCGDVKVNKYPLCIWDETDDDWASFCDFKDVSMYQELLLEANPCTYGNIGESTCTDTWANNGQCQWCEEVSRCLSPDLSCDIFGRDSRAVAERKVAYETYIAKAGGKQAAFGPKIEITAQSERKLNRSSKKAKSPSQKKERGLFLRAKKTKTNRSHKQKLASINTDRLSIVNVDESSPQTEDTVDESSPQTEDTVDSLGPYASIADVDESSPQSGDTVGSLGPYAGLGPYADLGPYAGLRK